MPVHDWSRVSAGTFHDFHVVWLAEIRNALIAVLTERDTLDCADVVPGFALAVRAMFA